MSSTVSSKKIIKYRVGEIPLMESIVKKLNLRGILNDFLPQTMREEIAPADALLLIIYNLAIGKTPLYYLDEWVHSLELRCIGCEKYRNIPLSDDRFGRALDRLYEIDRASLMTRIVLEVVKIFKIDLQQIHNDSTSIKAFGKYPGITSSGFELKKGLSKDFRPDLKQLIYSLSISADGAVPVHYKIYPGNRNDDTTHIETWNTLCEITQNPNFLYVADSKLCTDRQLKHIFENGGRALTPMPESWKEVKLFKESLRNSRKAKREIWRRVKEGNIIEYFSVYDEEETLTKQGYKIHWIHSSERQEEDFNSREARLKKAENELQEIQLRLNRKKFCSEEVISEECEKILQHRKVKGLIKFTIGQTTQRYIVKQGRGRPSKKENQNIIEKKTFTLDWARDKEALKAEKKVDGVFPLLSTDLNLSAKEAIVAYKYQPRLEKRFTHLKSIHNIAPLFCKKLERIEANMFLFFIALTIQALIEREIRYKMKEKEIQSLQVYPESRDAIHPTTSKVFDIFGSVYTYELVQEHDIVEQYKDELNHVQKSILELLSISQEAYWEGTI
jgi:transposase